MPYSEKELTELLSKIQDNFEKTWNAGDSKKFVELYHPEGVLVLTGKWVAHGRKAVGEKYASLSAFKIHLKSDVNLEAGNGEYLIQKGRYEFKDKPGVYMPYEQIYKRELDGTYLIYHDEFIM